MGLLKIGAGAWSGAWVGRLTLLGSALVHGAGIAGVAVALPPSPPRGGAAPSTAPPLAFDVLAFEIESASPAPSAPVIAVSPDQPRAAAPSSRQRAAAPRNSEMARAPATQVREAAAVPSDPLPLDSRELTPEAGPTVLPPTVLPPTPEPKAVALAPSAIATSSWPVRAEDGASMALYARAMQIRLGRAAASPDVVALVERRANLVLQIVVNVDGTVREARVVQGDVDPVLRNAALRIERSAEPFPPLPPEIRAGGPVAFRLPLRFVLRPR